jgi:hypothetical protein
LRIGLKGPRAGRSLPQGPRWRKRSAALQRRQRRAIFSAGGRLAAFNRFYWPDPVRQLAAQLNRCLDRANHDLSCGMEASCFSTRRCQPSE